VILKGQSRPMRMSPIALRTRPKKTGGPRIWKICWPKHRDSLRPASGTCGAIRTRWRNASGVLSILVN